MMKLTYKIKDKERYNEIQRKSYHKNRDKRLLKRKERNDKRRDDIREYDKKYNKEKNQISLPIRCNRDIAQKFRDLAKLYNKSQGEFLEILLEINFKTKNPFN